MTETFIVVTLKLTPMSAVPVAVAVVWGHSASKIGNRIVNECTHTHTLPN